MKKKGQRTFNNENVHRIKMLGLPLYPLYSPWLLDIFHQRGKVIDSSPASKSSAPSETKGAIHSTKIQIGPTAKRGPPQKMDQFFRNFSGWTKPIH